MNLVAVTILNFACPNYFICRVTEEVKSYVNSTQVKIIYSTKYTDEKHTGCVIEFIDKQQYVVKEKCDNIRGEIK